MIKTNEDISTTKKRITIEIPSDAIEQEIQGSLQEVRRSAKLPGFRKGKAPMNLIEKRFGKDVEADALDRLVPKHVTEALKEAEVMPVARPVLEGGLELKRGEPMPLTFTVEVRPTVEVSHESIKVKDIPVKVEDRDVEETIKRLQHERATYEPSEGPVETGQLVIMDYTSREDEKEFKDEVFKVGTDLMPEAFSKGLVGAKKGEATEIKVDFPEDYHAKELAGQSRTFDVIVKEIKDENVPANDDEFAKDLEFDDMKSLQAHVRERLETQQGASIARIQKGLLMKELIDKHDFEPPESFVEGEIESLLAQERSAALARPADGEKAPALDEAARQKELRPEAVRRAKASVLLDIIGEKEDVEVSEDDMKERILRMSFEANVTPEHLMKYYTAKDGSLDGLKQAVFEEKVLDLILEKAEIEPAKEAEEKAEKK